MFVWFLLTRFLLIKDSLGTAHRSKGTPQAKQAGSLPADLFLGCGLANLGLREFDVKAPSHAAGTNDQHGV